MRFTLCAALVAAALASFSTSLPIEKRAAADSYTSNILNLVPEDRVGDFARGLLYTSNLFKGRIAVENVNTKAKFNVLVPGVSSSGDGAQQAAGLSVNTRTNPSSLYMVAKDAGAFRFDGSQSKNGPCSLHKFNLPLSSTSTPAWSVYFDAVQKQFEALSGIRPFGNVASAQDQAGNSYVVFALGMAAIAKVSPDGKTVTPFYFEKPTTATQRPGYTGIVYLREVNALIAYGGPRPLTIFRLSDAQPTGKPITINGDFGSLSGTEKIKVVPSRNNSGLRLIAAKAPFLYSFKSTDGWNSVTFKKATRNEFNSNDLTAAVELNVRNSGLALYGSGAYFSNGAKGGRQNWPVYKASDDLLL